MLIFGQSGEAMISSSLPAKGLDRRLRLRERERRLGVLLAVLVVAPRRCADVLLRDVLSVGEGGAEGRLG